MTGRGHRAYREELTSLLTDDFRPDYGDCFGIATAPDVTARAWAASSLRGAAAAHGTFSRLVWDGLLGFELAPFGDPGTLVGWRIRHESTTRFEVETDGSLMAGRMVFLVDGEQATWATMLRFHKAAGRRIWAVAGHAHRALAPRCLERAGYAVHHNSQTTTEAR